MKYILIIFFLFSGCCTTKTVYYNSKYEKCDTTKCIKCIDIRYWR